MKYITFFGFLFLSISSFAQDLEAPLWFKKDIARKAQWLPNSIKENGLRFAYSRRFNLLPRNVQIALKQLNIPAWMIALIPTAPSIQDEITKQLLGITSLSGEVPEGNLAKRAEQLLIFGASAQLPTPGDNTAGESLGAEGCTAAMSKYILSQLKLEYPKQLKSLSDNLATTQSSAEMKEMFFTLRKNGATWFDIKIYSFDELRASDIKPGSIMIAQKPGGTHTFAWTRVFSFWRWSESAKMAIGNTGLPQFGSRLILAQEYISDDPQENEGGYSEHNEHGPINSHQIIYDNSGKPILSNPHTNVYAAQGSNFVLINLH